MRAEHTEPGIEPEVVARTSQGRSRTGSVLMVVILLVGYTTGFLSRPMVMPTDLSATEKSASVEVTVQEGEETPPPTEVRLGGGESSGLSTAQGQIQEDSASEDQPYPGPSVQGQQANAAAPRQHWPLLPEPSPIEIDKDMPLTQSYQLLAQQVAELSHQASEEGPPTLEQSVQMLAQEIKELRTLNPYYRFKEIKAATIPTGVPPGYGDVLQVSFDQVQASMDILSRMGPTFGADKIKLSGPDLERYIRVGEQTACRYCCGARTLVSSDGEAACRCGHSQAMRGLAAYLITEQGERYSDEEIVAELNKWRTTYFPKQTLAETLWAMKRAGEPGIEELEAEFPEFMPDMVGGC